MGRRERPVDPAEGPLKDFACQLRELREAAGSPSYRELARRAHFSSTSLSVAASGKTMPSLEVTLGYVRACGGDVEEWERRWRATALRLGIAGSPRAGMGASGRPGRPDIRRPGMGTPDMAVSGGPGERSAAGAAGRSGVPGGWTASAGGPGSSLPDAPAIRPRNGAYAVPAQLPSAAAAFTGRNAELRELDLLLEAPGRAPNRRRQR